MQVCIVCVCHRGVAPGSPYLIYFWRFLYPDAITIRLHGTQKQHLAPHSKHLKRTNTPLNQKGVSHRGVGVAVAVAVGVAHFDVRFFSCHSMDLCCGLLAPHASKWCFVSLTCKHSSTVLA